MRPQFANLIISKGCDAPCSVSEHFGVQPGSSCSSPDCWGQGSSCSSGSWRLDAASPTKQHQLGTSVYSKLRVSIPGAGDSDTAGSSSSEGSSPSACAVGSDSCSNTPGGCAVPALLCLPALLAGNGLIPAGGQAAVSAVEQFQQGSCLSSCGSAARRLLTCEVGDNAHVSSWLEQQISVREGARASTCNIDGPNTPEVGEDELLEAAAAGCFNRKGLPRPAFQLLGLL